MNTGYEILIVGVGWIRLGQYEIIDLSCLNDERVNSEKRVVEEEVIWIKDFPVGYRS